MLNVKSMRHPKERLYFFISAAIGSLLWFVIIVGTLGLVLFYGIFVALGLWITQQFFKAVIYGNAVRVTEDQYPTIHDIVESNCSELGLTTIPDVFIVNGQGAVNAVAVRFHSKRYVLLFSDLVDLMLEREAINELKMIIGHELAHHAAGHTSVFRNLLIGPTKFIPFLGPAYSRACELTADRIGHALTDDNEASRRALISVVSGSKALASHVNIDAFREQEAQIPMLFGFLHEIFASHPRMTRRIVEIDKISALVQTAFDEERS